jgi:hypothetical protein
MGIISVFFIIPCFSLPGVSLVNEKHRRATYLVTILSEKVQEFCELKKQF